MAISKREEAKGEMMVKRVSAIALALLMALSMCSIMVAAFPEAAACDEGGEAEWGYYDYGGYGYTDLNAAYYYYLFSAEDNQDLRFEFKGEFPHARYMSFTLYDEGQLPVDALHDVDINPDPWNRNPFRPGVDRTVANRSYTVQMVPEGSAHAGEPNTLVISDEVKTAVLLMRVYLPDDGQPLDGGVGMPSTSTFYDATGETAPGPAWMDVGDYRDTTIRELLEMQEYVHAYRDALSPYVESWSVDESYFLPQYGSPYVWTSLDYYPELGDIAVMRFRAPTFTDTSGGGGEFTGEEDVRYFSVSVAASWTTITQRTIHDSELVIDEDGFVNLVIGAPRWLANRAKSKGWNVLPGKLDQKPMVVFRQMLPRDDFAGSFMVLPELDIFVPPEQSGALEKAASQHIGDWALQGDYCTKREFRRMLR